MWKLLFFILLGLLLACKNDKSEKPVTEGQGEKVADTSRTTLGDLANPGPDLSAPTQGAIPAHGAKVHTTDTDLIIPRQIHQTDDRVDLNLTYPYLNEDIDKKYVSFNNFITTNYLKASKTSHQSPKDADLPDGNRRSKYFYKKEILDYQLFTANDVLLSLAIYKADYGVGNQATVTKVKALNFDLDKGGFLSYDDFFEPGSEKELLAKINEVIAKRLRKEKMQGECAVISDKDFQESKNNFVINGDSILFYLEGHVTCPAFRANNAVEISLEDIKELLKPNAVFTEDFQ